MKNNIDNVWDESGYDTCSRVGGAIYEKLKGEDEHFNYALSTVVNYTRKGTNELYGVPFGEEGVLGSCVYQWCKKENDAWVDIAGETGTTYSVVMTDRATYCCKAVLTKGGE